MTNERVTVDEVMRLAVAYSFLEPGSEPALRTAVKQLVTDRDAMRAVLHDLALFGTRHDTNPTRLLASMQTNELAATLDMWWLGYLQRADEQVRSIARAALKGKP